MFGKNNHKKSNHQWQIALLLTLFCCGTAVAYDQSALSGARQVRYDDILAQRIHQSDALDAPIPTDGTGNAPQLALSTEKNLTDQDGFYIHWVGSSDLMTAALNPTIAMRFGEQPYHSQTDTLGWRVGTQLGWVTPYAQVSYQRQSSDDINGPTGANSAWRDVTVGAQLPLTPRFAAFAAVSQTSGFNIDQQYIYNFGVNAHF